MRALVVDDDEDILAAVSLSLLTRWPDSAIRLSRDVATALRLFEAEQPDVVVLDLGLPDGDGWELCERFRRQSHVGILILSVRYQIEDIVKGLEAGADDYLTKPFRQPEFIARINAILRRVEQLPLTGLSVFADGDLTINFKSREVHLHGNEVRLTATEYNLLREFALNRGRCMTHRTLLAKVWGPAYVDSADILKVHIQHLRRKLEDSSTSQHIIATEHGIGYKFIA